MAENGDTYNSHPEHIHESIPKKVSFLDIIVLMYMYMYRSNYYFAFKLTQMKSKDVFAEAQKVCESLKVIETLTYSCDNGDVLPDLNHQLEEALIEIKQHITSSEGIIVTLAIA